MKTINIFILTVIILSGCAQSDRDKPLEFQGMIASVNGKVKVLSKTEESTVCATQFCEPNYIYYAKFGRKRHEPTPPAPQPAPAPAPVPVPVPVPTTTPTPNPTTTPIPSPTLTPNPLQGGIPAGETLDYSKQILKLSDAWKITAGSQQVIVAIVDTGVDINHPDLKNNIWVNEKEKTGKSGIDDDGNGFVDDVYGWDFANNRPNGIDDNMHGTHCAGIIGAEANGNGTMGVSPFVKIMPLKFLTSTGSGSSSNAINAINYAIDNGAKIISNSWGGGGYSALLKQAIDRALNKGIYVVAAAGNETNDNDLNPSYPASYPGVLSVASTDSNDLLSTFSNYGKNSVWIAAPGSNIYSTIPNGAYKNLSGTSMATPQVSGALALGLSMGKSTMIDLKQVLCTTSVKILQNDTVCGRMDVYQFLKSLE